MLAVFFSYKEIFETQKFGQDLCCLGCRLTSILRGERDHYKHEKRRIITTWLKTSKGLNGDNLNRSLYDFVDRDIQGVARRLDQLHLQESTMGPDPYDKENNERQIPIPWERLNNKRGTQYRSPTIKEKLPDTNGGVDWWRAARYDGHGMTH